MRSYSWRIVAAVCTVVVLVAATAGISSGATHRASVATRESRSAAVKAASAQITQDAPINPKITVPSLLHKAPKGKTLDYVGCPVAICVQVADGAQAAAKALGWKFNLINGGLTPATFLSAWGQIAANPPTVVAGVGLLPVSAYAKDLKAVRAAHVPYVAVTSPTPPGNGLDAIISGPPEVKLSGTLMADWIVKDANGASSDTLYVYDPSLTALASALTGYTQRLAQLCPGCKVATLKVSSADVGTKIPEEVVSYLQANPNVKYVVMGLSDLAAGLPQAIKAASLSQQVKIVGRAVDQTNFGDIADGGMAAGFTEEGLEAGWRAVDALLREMEGQKLASTQPIGVIHLINESDVPKNEKQPYIVPGYQQAYEKAWGIAK